MAGLFVPWLVDAARLTGYPVVEMTGWRTRGHGPMAAVEGVVAHHTAGPRTGEYPSLAVVRDGRAGLAGPLSQLGIGRSGTVYVIAAGAAWHAGESAWAGMTSLNSRFLGIEAESAGTGGDWTADQLDCYPRLVAALLHYMRRPASRVAGHREVAIPAGRKIDPAGIDMEAFRARVADLLADPLQRIPRRAAAPPPEPPPPPPRPREDDVMYIKCKPYPDRPDIWTAILSGPILMGLGSANEVSSADEAIAKGATVQWVERFTWDALDALSHRVCDNPRPVLVQTPASEPDPSTDPEGDVTHG